MIALPELFCVVLVRQNFVHSDQHTGYESSSVCFWANLGWGLFCVF